MRKSAKTLTAVFLSAAISISQTVGVLAAAIGSTTISSSGACVMDFDTGDVLYEYDGNTMRVPASMTKIMNMYCVYEAIENGEISLDTVVPISKSVYDKSRNSLYQSVLPLYYNTTYTVDEMIDVVVAYSASGAATALAELVGGGSEAEFVKRMNDKAAQMGIDAYYYDSCGIANNKISPIGMATLARNIINDYPDILARSSKGRVSFHGGSYRSTNHLFDTYYYAGADGLKTGTTSSAGYCFCGTAVRGGRRMISVTMNSSSSGQRFVDTARLLDYGFDKASSKYGGIYFTDMRTFINGTEMPTFAYTGENPRAVIVAEDLKDYGFDTSYDSQTRTFTATYNKDKPINPIPLDLYKNKNGRLAYNINMSENINVVIDDGITKHNLTDVYNINGYVCISIDELQKIYYFEWNENDNAAYITAWAKQPEYPILDNERLTSKSAYIMDFDTGNELYAFDENTQRPAASIAKMMSVYVILDAIKNGEVTLDSIVPISENVYNLSRLPDYKMMAELNYDEEYTLDEMLDMIIIDSAAACVTASAELICGSESEFVKRMNEKARQIGMSAVFYNGTGVCLNPSVDKENLMSAKDTAIMARALIRDYPNITERTKRASVDFHGNTYYNLNKLFTDYYYNGADGFKNGMTNAAGYCMCATALRDGKRVISVTLPSDSNESRFTDSIKMLDYGFKKLGVDTSNSHNSKPAVITAENIKINIDGNYEMKFDKQNPITENGAVLAPACQLMETLKKNVSYNSNTHEIIISDDVTSVRIKDGDSIMVKSIKNPIDGTVSTENITLENAPVTINNIILAPVRELTEAFGAAVIWDEDNDTLLIIAGVC